MPGPDNVSVPALLFLALTVVGLGINYFELLLLWQLRRRKAPDLTEFPEVSVLKPLAGLDDGLWENLESHLAVDYPGTWEMILGIRSKEDPAYETAVRFQAAHPDRVRLCMQQGEPGHNPKVNQLISLTREAKYEILACSDSNVRVPRQYLRELVGLLCEPAVGVASHVFVGTGERRLGAVLDNLLLASMAAPTLATNFRLALISGVVGKSVGIRRGVLQELGGWQAFKDVLAEDYLLGAGIQAQGLRVEACPTPVENVQESQGPAFFFHRHARWAMIRSKNVFPLYALEFVQIPLVSATVAALLVGSAPVGLGIWIAAAVLMALHADLAARILRGKGFRLDHLLLVPLRDLIYVAAWLRGGTLREVSWRGNRFRVLAHTRLATREAIHRARRIRRGG